MYTIYFIWTLYSVFNLKYTSTTLRVQSAGEVAPEVATAQCCVSWQRGVGD
jgi:hypothetical protein